MSHLGHRLSALIDGELSDAERDRVLAHLAGCDACRQDAIALRALKQRMHSLGEAMVDAALTGRLMAVGATGGPSPWPGRAPWRTKTGSSAPRLLAAGILASAVAGLGAAAFYAGGDQVVPGPKVTPAVDTFLVQHANVIGEVPVAPPSSGPASGSTTGRTGSAPAGSAPAGSAPAGSGPAAGGTASQGSAGTGTAGSGPASHTAVSPRAVRSELLSPVAPAASPSAQVRPAVGHPFATPGP
jgi:putative zinc finger protein